MFCKFCGNKLNDNARFCASCGSKIEVNVQSNSVNEFIRETESNKISNVSSDALEDRESIRRKVHKKCSKVAVVVTLLLLGIVITAGVLFVRLVPRSGYNRGRCSVTEEEVKSIRELYPEVDWSDGRLNRVLGTVVDNIITDLEKKEDYRTIRYDFATNTAKIDGTMERKYVFQGGKWTFDSITEHTESFEWSLEGIYEFVLDNEIYCNIMIDSIDLENERAHVYWYASYEDDFSGDYLEDFWMGVWDLKTKLKFKEAKEEEEVIIFLDYEVSIAGNESKRMRFGMIATKEDLYCGLEEKSSGRVPSGAAANLKKETTIPQKVGGFKKVIRN